jgi:hypothetical protein
MLNAYEDLLEANDFEILELAPGETQPVQQLFVDLGDDVVLSLVFLSQMKEQVQETATREVLETMESTRTDFLQFFINFPFEVQEQAFSDLARLLLMLNWGISVGALGMNESRKIVYYRQVMECFGQAPSPERVVETVNGMMYYANLYIEIIRDVAVGEASLEGVLAAIESANLREEVFSGYDL